MGRQLGKKRKSRRGWKGEEGEQKEDGQKGRSSGRKVGRKRNKGNDLRNKKYLTTDDRCLQDIYIFSFNLMASKLSHAY